jgi:AraC family transcriptional regulator of adaptative response / DNA-3-methyladenine glycosylase II
VGYLAMRILGAPDVFLANDAAVRNGIKALDRPENQSPAGAERSWTADPDFREVSPWRSYATMHLWRAAAQSPAGTRPGTTKDIATAGSRTAEKANQ